MEDLATKENRVIYTSCARNESTHTFWLKCFYSTLDPDHLLSRTSIADTNSDGLLSLYEVFVDVQARTGSEYNHPQRWVGSQFESDDYCYFGDGHYGD